MLTYQDLTLAGTDETARMDFVRRAISWHCSTPLYKTAVTAWEYFCGRNTTIRRYEKTLVNALGQIIPDRWSPNHKSASNFFNIFETQLSQYLLANGPTWGKADTAAKLGANFDTKLSEAGLQALIGGVSFGFWDSKQLHVFRVTEFVPLFDEENGSLSAGVRFWRLDPRKPLRATLYELDGYTDYIWREEVDKNGVSTGRESGQVMHAKRPYIIVAKGDAKDVEDGTLEYEGLNFPAFPIVPLYGNVQHESELVQMREKIDAYDLILNGFENDLDNAQIYWILKGADGMNQEDMRQFLQQLHTLQVANPSNGQEVQAVTVNIPYEARQQLLHSLETRLYKDAQAMDPSTIVSGAATATQIRAAYEPLNTKADQFEYRVLDFLQGILTVAGLEDKASFVRSMVMNIQEEIQSLVMAAQFLSDDYITRRILRVLGDGDQFDSVMEELEEQRDMEGAEDDSEDVEAFWTDAESLLNEFLGGETDGGDTGTEKTAVSA